MKIINVIEYIGQTISSVNSFPILSDVNEQNQVDKAEQLFTAKAKENGMNEDDKDSYIEDGSFSDGHEYQVFLVWSE